MSLRPQSLAVSFIACGVVMILSIMTASRLPLNMQCNIDAKGKAVRLILGGVLTFAGVIFAMAWILGDGEPRWPLWVGLGLLVAGGVAIVEGWAGWCAVRALGLKTRW